MLFLVPYLSALLEIENDEHHDYGPIDSIHYKGGPISQKEHAEFRRQYFTDGHKLAMRKKKDGNDESESDNSDESGTRTGTKRRATAKPTAHERANSKNQTLPEVVSNGLNQAYDSDCIPISPQK